MRITSRRAATGSAFVSMLFLGVGIAIVGATAQAVGLSPSQIGYLIAVQNVGMGIAVVIAGALADLYPKPAILTTGLVLLGVSFAMLYRSDVFMVNLIVMLLMGTGIGAVEAVTDALLLDMHKKHESRYVAINHFFVTVGMVGITLYLMALDLNWRTSLTQIAVALGVLVIPVAMLRPSGHRAGVSSLAILREITADGGLVLLFLAGAGAIGIGVGSTGVLTTFATRMRGMTAEHAQMTLAVFLVGMAAGRVLTGVLPGHGRPAIIAIAAACSAFVCSTVLFLVPLPGALVTGFALLAGLSVAPLLPLTIATAGLRYRHAAGTAMGVVKLAIPVGGIVFPGLYGLVADVGSFQASLYLLPACALLVLAATALGERRKAG